MNLPDEDEAVANGHDVLAVLLLGVLLDQPAKTKHEMSNLILSIFA